MLSGYCCESGPERRDHGDWVACNENHNRTKLFLGTPERGGVKDKRIIIAARLCMMSDTYHTV